MAETWPDEADVRAGVSYGPVTGEEYTGTLGAVSSAESASVKERLLEAIVNALGLISTAAGYHYDVAEVVRPRRTGENFVPKHLGISVLAGDERKSPIEEEHVAGNPPAIAWELAVAIDLVVRLPESSVEPMDKVLCLFQADVQQALMQDWSFGGLAIRTELGPTLYPDAGGGVEGLTQVLIVAYRVSEDDPSQNRA
jgi:hypothetical protein